MVVFLKKICFTTFINEFFAILALFCTRQNFFMTWNILLELRNKYLKIVLCGKWECFSYLKMSMAGVQQWPKPSADYPDQRWLCYWKSSVNKSSLCQYKSVTKNYHNIGRENIVCDEGLTMISLHIAKFHRTNKHFFTICGKPWKCNDFMFFYHMGHDIFCKTPFHAIFQQHNK